MVLRESLWLLAIGIAVGLPAALAASRFISSMLFGVMRYDPTTILTTPLLLATVAALAGSLRARRACQIDPMVALRYERSNFRLLSADWPIAIVAYRFQPPVTVAVITNPAT